MSLKSHLTRLPDFSELTIPEKQRLITVQDSAIFRDLLNEKRTLVDCSGPAAAGDYVLVETSDASGHRRTLHIELGKKKYPEPEAALIGHSAGETVQADFYGVPTDIKITSVRRVLDYPITDESIAALEIPGVNSVIDYRRYYLNEHGTEIADRLFSAMYDKLKAQLDSLSEWVIDPDELESYHQQERGQIQNLSGNVDKRLMETYGCSTPEEADRCFLEELRSVFCSYVFSFCLAEKNHDAPSAQETQKLLGEYCEMLGKTEDEVRAEGLLDAALMPYYLSYSDQKLNEYFRSAVSFHAEGISALPCKV